MKTWTRYICTLCAALLFVPFNAAFATIVLDLATPNGTDDAPVTLSGMIDDAIFSFGQPNAGTGGFDPFLRIQKNGDEQGYNTDNSNPGFDEKTGAWTHSVLVADLPVVQLNNITYFEFLLDVNEVQNGNGRRISLDQLQIFESMSDNLNTTDLGMLGTQVYNLDDGMDNTVLFNTFNGGSGAADYSVLIEVWPNADPSKFMTFYTQMGTYTDGVEDWTSGDGFEEWAFDNERPKFVPEPSQVLLMCVFGSGVFVWRRFTSFLQ